MPEVPCQRFHWPRVKVWAPTDGVAVVVVGAVVVGVVVVGVVVVGAVVVGVVVVGVVVVGVVVVGVVVVGAVAVVPPEEVAVAVGATVPVGPEVPEATAWELN